MDTGGPPGTPSQLGPVVSLVAPAHTTDREFLRSAIRGLPRLLLRVTALADQQTMFQPERRQFGQSKRAFQCDCMTAIGQ